MGISQPGLKAASAQVGGFQGMRLGSPKLEASPKWPGSLMKQVFVFAAASSSLSLILLVSSFSFL